MNTGFVAGGRERGGIGVGRVSFFLLGSGFGFFDFARVGSRVLDFFFGSKEKFLGSLRVKKIYVRVKLGSKFFAFLTKIRPQMTKIWRKMQKIGFISHNFLTSGYSG